MFGFTDLKKKHFRGNSIFVADSWISNGWWAVRKDVARMKFSESDFDVEKKDDADVEQLISKVLKGNVKEYVRTSVGYYMCDMKEFGVVFRSRDDIESIVLINSECVRDFNIFSLFGDVWCSVAETKMPYIYSRSHPMFMVMPMVYDEKIIDSLKCLREAHDLEKGVWLETGMQWDLLF